jgi:hypothetical protein
MSNTIISTANTTGVRRLRTLGEWALLDGAPSSLALQMIQDGYDISVITTLADLGATDAQLQYLYDNYGAGTAEFAQAANQLQVQLSGRAGGTVSPGAQAPVPTTISTAFGVYDLLQQSSWDAINSLFVAAQQRLQALAAKLPGDPDVRAMVGEFNGYVAQWANYYQQAVGNAPSPSAQVTLGALGILPIIVVGIVVGVGALIAALYGFITGKLAQKEQAAAATQTAQNQSALLAQYNAAVAKGDTTTARALLSTIQATGAPPPPSGPQNWSLWFQQNSGLLVGGLIAAVVVKSLLSRR